MKTSTLKILHTFSEHTTAHGWAHVVQSQNFGKKVFWFLLTICVHMALFICIILLLHGYLSYPKSIMIKSSSGHIEFPNVVFCPTTQWSEEFIQQDPSQYFKQTMHTIVENAPTDKKCNTEGHMFAGRVMMQAVMANRLPTLRRFVPSMNGSLLHCEFNYKKCDHSDFEEVFSEMFGLCYRFRVPTVGTDLNFHTGLQLLYFVEDLGWEEKFHASITDTQGAVVFIYRGQQSYLNFNRLAPVAVSAGFYTNLGLTYSTQLGISTINDPCRKTIDTWDDNAKKAVTVLYNPFTCLDHYGNTRIHDLCGCVLANLPIPVALSTVPRCYEVQVSSNDTIVNVNKTFQRHNCSDHFIRSQLIYLTPSSANCEKACSYYETTLQSSLSRLPIKGQRFKEYGELVAHKFDEFKRRGVSSSVDTIINKNSTFYVNADAVQNNLVGVNIFIHSFHQLEFQEQLAYPWLSFVSEAGGMFGLWLGASVVTLTEIMFLIPTFCISAFKNTKNTAQSPTEMKPHT